MTQSILVLGAGFVVGPVVEYLTRENNYNLTVASQFLEEAEKYAQKYPNVTPIVADVTNTHSMQELIREHDLVISLVPYIFHVPIAKICIEQKIPMITASYVSSEMKALDDAAKTSGVLILNEIGLDPGIDHLSAMKIIDDAHDKGGKVVSFASWCGGLPAPECNDNPLGYKFSWAPRAVLLALLNQAKYLKAGEETIIDSDNLLASAQSVDVGTTFKLEGYPNRDSTGYKQGYNIPEVKNLIRGTLRYLGFSEILESAKKLGLLSLDEAVDNSLDWAKWMQGKIESKSIILSEQTRVAFEWLGLFGDSLLPKANSMLDAFCVVLQDKLNYQKGEFDMVVLQHKFEIAYPSQTEFLSSTLIVKGDPNGFSAMAKTVGYPAAIAAELILTGEINEVGVKIPVSPNLYEPILEKLEQENIICKEKHELSLNEGYFH